MRIRRKHQAGPTEPEPQHEAQPIELQEPAEPTEAEPQPEPPEEVAVEAEPEPSESEVVASLLLEVAALKQKMLQTMAEAQNMRKRTLQQMEDSRKFASEPLVKELIKVCDNFSRAITAAENNPSFEALLDGVKAVERQLGQALKTVSVERIPAVGAPFDPRMHEAIDVEVSEEHDEDTVVEELLAGYVMHGRVVRPAKVKVSQKP